MRVSMGRNRKNAHLHEAYLLDNRYENILGVSWDGERIQFG